MSQSRSQRLRRAKVQLRIRMLNERRLEALLKAELIRACSEAAAAYPSWTKVLPAHQARVRRILAASLSRTAVAGARHVRSLFRKKSAPDQAETKLDTQEELDARVVAVAKRRARDRAVDVSRTTRTRIFNEIERGLASHDAPDLIARGIRDVVGDMSAARARTIARTETAVAMNTAQHDEMVDTAEELGLTMIKTWTSTEDERTRDSHKEADGQTVNLSDVFHVGGSDLRYPSDPEGPPEEVINCRCAILYDTR